MDPGNAAENRNQDDDQSIDEEEGVVNGIDWDMWWQIIVHRNEGVRDAEMPEYPPQAWSTDPKDPPFPFNLEATWYCAMILGAILAVHCEIDTTWLLKHGYLHYFVRISHKTLLTIAISFASTIIFEVIGNVLDLARLSYVYGIIIAVDRFFVETFHWGPVNAAGGVDWGPDGQIQFHQDETHLREPIRRAVMGILVSAFNYSLALFSYLLPMSAGSWFVWLAYRVSPDLTAFFLNALRYFMLPLPDAHETTDIKTILWEYGPPVCFQLLAAALTYLCVFLFMSRSETPLILYHTGLDPFSKLTYSLLRAVTAHILAYTAYQVLCFCVMVIPPPYLMARDYLFFLTKDPVLRKFHTLLHGGPSVIILLTHYILRAFCTRLVRLLFPLWVPYIVWLSIKSEIATRRNWISYSRVLDKDMDVFEEGNRVIGKVFMTMMFGMKSSWPARMRLSTLEDVD